MKRYFHNLITGERRVAFGPILRPFLLFASLLFFLAAKVRFFLYKSGVFCCKKLPVPVISVGNITWGGTGKTPLVEAILLWLNAARLSPVLLTRGYGNDEDKMVSSRFPNVFVLSGKRRLRNALNYLKTAHAGVFILDDGFQHLGISRDIDIVTVSAVSPFGNSRLIPAGSLREPISALKRADIIVLTKADLVTDKQLSRISRFVRAASNGALIFYARHVPVSLKISGIREKGLEYIKGKQVICVSALADNRSFVKTVENLGATCVDSFSYIDHHLYTGCDVDRILQASKRRGVDIVLTTEKDWVKLAPLTAKPGIGGIEFTVLRVELKITEEEVFYGRLSALFHS
ncbi:MAG: tetraacyldisaccharide 4'-kinase [Candidatus Omnitrophica bacterium]|nr:tetraacyldisaccharide 4'-kinase [Candidatus Omnitrophota bacterium]